MREGEGEKDKLPVWAGVEMEFLPEGSAMEIVRVNSNHVIRLLKCSLFVRRKMDSFLRSAEDGIPCLLQNRLVA